LLLPTANCPSCSRPSLVYRAPPEDLSRGAELETRCLDCDTLLDRFGIAPVIIDRPLSAMAELGYSDLDRPSPVGPAGCFVGGGCEGCSKIESRPW
jgi:hypothetical protein